MSRGTARFIVEVARVADPTDFCAMFAAREAASDRRTGVRLVRTVRWCYPDRGAHLRGTEWATWWCVALALAAC